MNWHLAFSLVPRLSTDPLRNFLRNPSLFQYFRGKTKQSVSCIYESCIDSHCGPFCNSNVLGMVHETCENPEGNCNDCFYDPEDRANVEPSMSADAECFCQALLRFFLTCSVQGTVTDMISQLAGGVWAQTLQNIRGAFPSESMSMRSIPTEAVKPA